LVACLKRWLQRGSTTEVHATALALALASRDGASSGILPKKNGQAVGLPEEVAALRPEDAKKQQSNCTTGLTMEPIAV
jgi:hypothetical protein